MWRRNEKQESGPASEVSFHNLYKISKQHGTGVVTDMAFVKQLGTTFVSMLTYENALAVMHSASY